MDLEQIKRRLKIKQSVMNSYINQCDDIQDMKMMLEKLADDFTKLADKIPTK
uniref:hypothetical protein n=1 Tax=Clostridium sp. 12(A) TaxID=1163671 RepID=UPI0004B040EF|nr:hypothetical protein [Clostridium sp. 12(A)]